MSKFSRWYWGVCFAVISWTIFWGIIVALTSWASSASASQPSETSRLTFLAEVCFTGAISGEPSAFLGLEDVEQSKDHKGRDVYSFEDDSFRGRLRDYGAAPDAIRECIVYSSVNPKDSQRHGAILAEIGLWMDRIRDQHAFHEVPTINDPLQWRRLERCGQASMPETVVVLFYEDKLPVTVMAARSPELKIDCQQLETS